MQELYYSTSSSNLRLIREDNTITDFTISNLIVCSSLYEIIAFSGSTILVSFPIENTNLYYSDNIPIPPSTPSSGFTFFTSSAILIYKVNLVQNTISDSDMSGSGGFIYSGSTYYVSQSSGISSNGVISIAPNKPYTLLASGSGGIYNTYIEVYDTTIPTPFPTSVSDAIIFASGSSSITASFTPNSSSIYNVILSFIGDNSLP